MMEAEGQSGSLAQTPGALEHWQQVFDPRSAALVKAAAVVEARSVAQVQRLRRDWPAELVRVALELTAARRKAVKKFGEDNAQLMACDVIGIEQATSMCVAEHKAKRFETLSPKRIIDLCSGIGGDAMSLATVSSVLAVDQCAVRAWMTTCNANCDSITSSVEAIDIKGAAVHIDPDRRSTGIGNKQRAWQYEDYVPGPVYLEELVQQADAAAIKLGPGVAFDELPLSEDREIELISENGTLVQAVLWTGGLAIHAGMRCATMLPQGAMFVGVENKPVRSKSVGKYIYTIDPAIERAGLLGAFVDEHNIAAVHPKVGVLTSDEHLETSWLTGFAVCAVLPWRHAKVKEWLRAHQGGIVEVKTRGGVVNTDHVQRQLRGSGDERFTVFVLRLDQKVIAIISQRV